MAVNPFVKIYITGYKSVLMTNFGQEASFYRLLKIRKVNFKTYKLTVKDRHGSKAVFTCRYINKHLGRAAWSFQAGASAWGTFINTRYKRYYRTR